jgi:hypothetical protein
MTATARSAVEGQFSVQAFTSVCNTKYKLPPIGLAFFVAEGEHVFKWKKQCV